MITVQIFAVHVDLSNPAVVVGLVIIDALVLVAAGRVDRDFVLIPAQVAEAPLLLDRAQNVKELGN